jgi:hypothetical protein
VLRLDFGYASKPENSASAAGINFQGITVVQWWTFNVFLTLNRKKKNVNLTLHR